MSKSDHKQGFARVTYPMDNSTDPEFRHIDFAEVQKEFGNIKKMQSHDALDALEEISKFHWLTTDETEEVKKALAMQANILGNLEALEELGIEELYNPRGSDVVGC